MGAVREELSATAASMEVVTLGGSGTSASTGACAGTAATANGRPLRPDAFPARLGQIDGD